jgi:hypothetical protein
MRIFPIRSLASLSVICLGFSCNQYRHMQKIHTDENCVQKFRPDFNRAIYKTSVDVIGKHIGGILLIKAMPDSSTRIVFSNEMGFTFFDFGFLPGNGFTVFQIIPQMNKKALIRTLRNDFELIMFRNMDSIGNYSLTDSNRLVFHAYPQSRGVNYYVTDTGCHQLIKMQRASSKKPVMEARVEGSFPGNSPDSISIRHLNFNFLITLKKMSAIAAQ